MTTPEGLICKGIDWVDYISRQGGCQGVEEVKWGQKVWYIWGFLRVVDKYELEMSDT